MHFRCRLAVLASASIAVLAWAVPAAAEQHGEAPDAVSAAPPVYQLPKVGKPTGRVGGGRRGTGGLPDLYVLVPDHVGYTASTQPVLYWYLSEQAKGDVRFEVTLIDEGSPNPMVDQHLPAPGESGLQAIRLADYGVSLRPGQEYQWSISLVPEPGDRSKDVVSSGWIEVIPPPDGLDSQLAQAGPGGAAVVYGAAGLWYDTLDATASRVRSQPDDARARSDLAGLLSQVGLPESAAKP